MGEQEKKNRYNQFKLHWKYNDDLNNTAQHISNQDDIKFEFLSYGVNDS